MTRQSVVYLLAILAIIAGAIYVEISTWQECRQQHSWLYCVRMMHQN